MDDWTLTALRRSIAKWRRIVDGTGVDEGILNCPLCQAFYGGDCIGCPVMERAGNSGCCDTPYDVVGAMYVGDAGYADAAQDEVDFLISLLPEGVEP